MPPGLGVAIEEAQCPLLAQSGHLDCAEGCPLLGVKRTLQFDRAKSASDPYETFPISVFCSAN